MLLKIKSNPYSPLVCAFVCLLALVSKGKRIFLHFLERLNFNIIKIYFLTGYTGILHSVGTRIY